MINTQPAPPPREPSKRPPPKRDEDLTVEELLEIFSWAADAAD